MVSTTTRKRGFDRPFSNEQIYSWIYQPLMVVYYTVIVGLFLPSDRIIICLVPYYAMLLVFISCWLYVETTDSAEKGGIACICMKKTQEGCRYCSICKKTVPGLDHHCVWLNTCIGTRTYFFFYILIMMGTWAFGFQAAFGVVMMTEWAKDPSTVYRMDEYDLSLFKYRLIVGFHTAVAFSLTISYASMWIMHTYLCIIGQGTYDWMVSQNEQIVAKDKAKKATQTPTTGASSANIPPKPSVVRKPASDTTKTTTATTTTTTTNTTTAVTRAEPSKPSNDKAPKDESEMEMGNTMVVPTTESGVTQTAI